MDQKETEYSVIIFPENGKAVRLTVTTSDPSALMSELKAQYGENSIISMHDPIAAEKLR